MEGYHDYESIVAAEDYYGVPMGEYHTFGPDGEEQTQPRFLPRFHPLDTLTPACPMVKCMK